MGYPKFNKISYRPENIEGQDVPLCPKVFRPRMKDISTS